MFHRAHILKFGVASGGPGAVGAAAAQLEAGCQPSGGARREAAQSESNRLSSFHHVISFFYLKA